MKFVKRLVISYLLIFSFGLILALMPFINIYFMITSTFSLMIFLFYALMTVNLSFTILYIYLIFTKNEPNPNKCYDIGNYGFFCKLCDYYLKCKERKTNEKNK